MCPKPYLIIKIIIVAILLGRQRTEAFATALEILTKYDQIMSPETASMRATMIITREDGATRTYELRLLKKGDTKSRVFFDAPPTMRGQEILRVENNLWIYLPDIKRATPISNRDSFQGGDFSNSDILRSNLAEDYTPVITENCDSNSYCLDLTAKTKETAYQMIKLWLHRPDYLPIKAEYYDTSKRLLRSAKFDEPKEFAKGYIRPAHLVMTNELVKNKQQSEIRVQMIEVGLKISDSRFALSDLGK